MSSTHYCQQLTEALIQDMEQNILPEEISVRLSIHFTAT